MKSRSVVLSPAALDDLREMRNWIAQNGAPRTAAAYITRIRARIRSLDLAAERGISREDLLEGLRVVAIENVVVATRIRADRVYVLRVFAHGRDWERSLRSQFRRP